MRLYDTTGTWLYLIAEERAAFLAVARRKPARDRTLCEAPVQNRDTDSR
jgi:integrase/recombinase XerD